MKTMKRKTMKGMVRLNANFMYSFRVLIVEYMRLDFLVHDDEQTSNASPFEITQFFRSQEEDLQKDDDLEAIAREFQMRARGDREAESLAHEALMRAEPQALANLPASQGDTGVVDSRMDDEYLALANMWMIPALVSDIVSVSLRV